MDHQYRRVVTRCQLTAFLGRDQAQQSYLRTESSPRESRNLLSWLPARSTLRESQDMVESLRHVVLLADRIANPDQVGSVRAFIERLARRGLAARVVCSYWGETNRCGITVSEVSGLGDRWRLPWTIRGLRYDGGASKAVLLHVLQAGMAPAGLEIAERWQIPYLQGVEEFQTPGSRLRLSRRWCRGLVATSREVGDDLIRNCGVPPGWVRMAPPRSRFD